MTSNDKQIDLLMRRYTQTAPSVSVTEHLDADELNAFAEGVLPPATRARYVSHLADCDQCRRQASAVAISSGVAVQAEKSQTEIADGRTFWQALAGFLALPVLRYAAFAAMVLIIAGVAFLVLRRPRETALVAVNEPVSQQRETAVKPPAGPVYDDKENKHFSSPTPASPSAPVVGSSDQDLKRDGTPVTEDTVTKTQPAKETAEPAPVFAEKKKSGEEEVATAKPVPSYAPVPPGDAPSLAAGQKQQQQETFRNQQSVGAGISGPRVQQKIETTGASPVDKLAAQDRERDVAKDAGRLDDNRKAAEGQSTASNQPSNGRRGLNEKAKGPMRNAEVNTVNQAASEARAEPPKTVSGGADKHANSDEAPQTRAAGGRKFRRQGNAWVDQKFKSSMSLKSVSRGSEEFAALDSGLRSIAQQLGGEVIVVWKGKAYLIK